MSRHFTLRAVLVASGVSLFLLISSSYIALKLGALPWPIIFSVIVCGGLIKIFSGKKPVNIHEVNIAQAGASVGGLIAAGLSFTLPGLILLQKDAGIGSRFPSIWLLAVLTILAGFLGVFLSIPLKKVYIDQDQLPYPSGTAGAALLKLGETGGRAFYSILIVGALVGLFTLLRESYFPAGYTVLGLTGLGIFMTFFPMPLAVGVGYILGDKASVSWFVGAILGWLLFIPGLVATGVPVSEAPGYAHQLGMGLVLGSGSEFFVITFIPQIKSFLRPLKDAGAWFWLVLTLLVSLSLILFFVAEIPLLAAVTTLLGVLVVVPIAGRMTGETNINPLEQFGILVGLLVLLVSLVFSFQVSGTASFLLVAFVSVACAVAGDIGQDFKSAHLIGTPFKDMIRIDLITVLFSGLAAPFVLNLMLQSFSAELFTPAMPAPQSQMVAGALRGLSHPAVFWVGFLGAFVLETILQVTRKSSRVWISLMPLGIGLFLGLGLAIPLVLGGLVRRVIDKKYQQYYYGGLLVAAGVMGGEGVVGFSRGILVTLGVKQASLILGIVLTGLFLASVFLMRGFSKKGAA